MNHYYVVRPGKDGEAVTRLPLFGNETVLDAVSQIDGLSALAAKGRVEVVRDGKALGVNWRAITRIGQMATNYEIKPGDVVRVAGPPAKQRGSRTRRCSRSAGHDWFLGLHNSLSPAAAELGRSAAERSITMRYVTSSVLSLVLLSSLLAGDDKPAVVFSVGDKPPALKLGGFVKGEPFAELKADIVYVVEFWATWCRPCLDQMPHFSDLQKANPKVVFLWVDVWDKDQDAVKAFVKRMGEKMNFSVALDSECDDEGTGVMAKTWLPSLGGKGLPSTVIIDMTWKVAWMGAPNDVDKPLKGVVAGTWDIAAAAKEQKLRRQVEQTVEKFDARVQKALDVGPAETSKVLAEYSAALEKLRAELDAASKPKGK